MFCKLVRIGTNIQVTKGIEPTTKSNTPLFKKTTTEIEGICAVNYIPVCVSTATAAGGKHKKITRAELLASATAIGIKGQSRMNMAKLTEAIKAAKSSKKRKNK